jgi:hypothetical protein
LLTALRWPTPLAREHHGDEHLEPLHTRAPRYRLRPLLRPCACVRSGVHMQPGPSVWRFVRGLDSLTAQYSPLRGYSTHTQWRSALVRHGSAGLVAAHQCTHSGDALLRSKPRKGDCRATTRVRRRPRH